MKKGKMTWLLLLVLAVALVGPGAATAATTVEEWAAAIEARDAGMARAESLRAELLSRAGDGSPVERWRRMVRGEGSPEAIAADALALVDHLFPAGDPSRWEEVKGFWLPADVPVPLAALDAVFHGAVALLLMGGDRAPWLARSLVEALAASDRARTVAFRTAPAEVRALLEELAVQAPPPPVGGWPSGKALGRLPFAHAVSGWITETRATMQNMTFLNAFGVPVGGGGIYAWDRERGRLYRVLDSEHRKIWLFYDD
jgi:Sec-independent protein translocase protein TatA